MFAWRKYRGFTQETIADLAGLSVGTISNIETGQDGFSRESLYAVAKALDVEPGWLLSRDPFDPDDVWAFAEEIRKLPEQRREQLKRVMRAL